jgi:predicted nuclease of predicted toxin-antitoxin system
MLPDNKWEIWIDCNISSIIAKWMKDELGLNAKSAYLLQLHGLDDMEIYQKAKEAGQVILISKDSDLPELVNRYGHPPKLINVKIGNCDNRTMWRYLKTNLEAIFDKLVTENIAIVDLEL